MEPCQKATECAEVERDWLSAGPKEVLQDDRSGAQLGDENAWNVELGSQRVKRSLFLEQTKGSNLSRQALKTQRIRRCIRQRGALEPPHQDGCGHRMPMYAQQVSIDTAGEALRALRVTERSVDEGDRLN